MIKYLEERCENCRFWRPHQDMMDLEGTCWKIVPTTREETAWAGMRVEDPHVSVEFVTDFHFYCNLWEEKEDARISSSHRLRAGDTPADGYGTA